MKESSEQPVEKKLVTAAPPEAGCRKSKTVAWIGWDRMESVARPPRAKRQRHLE